MQRSSGADFEHFETWYAAFAALFLTVLYPEAEDADLARAGLETRLARQLSQQGRGKEALDAMSPLCTLRYTERIRPEAVETIKVFARTGVGIKVFASGSPEETAGPP